MNDVEKSKIRIRIRAIRYLLDHAAPDAFKRMKLETELEVLEEKLEV